MNKRRGPGVRAALAGLCLFVLALLAYGGFRVLFAPPPPEVRIPAVAGRTEAEALAALTEAGLSPETVPVYRLDLAPGIVQRTEPEEGLLVRKGRRVRVFVGEAAPMMEVPDLVGRPYEEARTILERAAAHRGLEVGLFLGEEVRFVASDTVPPGTILAQLPPAGEAVPVGTKVFVTVASEAGEILVTVPNLLGQRLETAERLLSDLGLLLGSVRKQDVVAPEGTILAMDPAPGTRLPPGGVVNLVVAGGVRPLFAPEHRTVTVSYTVPPEEKEAPFRITVEDADGTVVVFDGKAGGGTTLSSEVRVRGRAVARVFRGEVEVASWEI